MFALFRIFQRSGGILAVSIALVAFAFYGIALLSVILVDEPSRGLRILGVFLALSAAFCIFLSWAIRRAIAQARRPLDSAYEATTRMASMGGRGSRDALRVVGRRAASAGHFVGRVAVRAARVLFRVKRTRRKDTLPPSPLPADVIPLRKRDGSGAPGPG